MSLSAMLIAVRNTLRSTCGFSDFECDVQNDPQPYPGSGRRTIAVYPGECRGGPHSDGGMHEYIGINVGITLRLSGTPVDAVTSDLYLKTLTGVEDLQRQIRNAIHRNYTLMGAANTIIAGRYDVTADPTATPPVVGFTSDKFITALEWMWSTPVPEIKLGDWFYSDNENEIARKHGLFADVRFANAHRPQRNELMR
jgi:hypothetical protein